MISFIVIGKNEGWKLLQCFKSISTCVEINNIIHYEVIYVDSNSIDDSLSVANKIENLRLFRIDGKCNAAIARNIGGQEARGDILVFIDGDMELNPYFFKLVITTKQQMIYPFVTGIYRYCYYDKHNIVVKEKIHNIIESNTFGKATGGFFIITKKLWCEVGEMDCRLDRNEDIDLGLRLCKQGIPPMMIAENCINHYTDINKLSANFWRIVFYYRYPAVLSRKHLLNKHYLPIFLRFNYTSILLFLVAILLFANIYIFIFYILGISARAYVNRNYKSARMILFYLLRDVVFVISFFFYYPQSLPMLYKDC